MTRRLFQRHRPRRRWLRTFLTFVLLAVAGSAVVLLGCDWWIDRSAEPYTTDRVESVPPADVAVVLGTAPYVADQRRNLYFEYRLDAAAELQKAGKVKFLLVSGDNRARDYDEPTAMRDGLVARGVPPEAIYRDIAGVRTLDSVLRARDVFAQSRYIVVSQGFHTNRAVWLARQNGIEAYGYDARDVPFGSAQQMLRQYLAAVRAVYDVVVGTESQNSGPRVEIGSAPPN